MKLSSLFTYNNTCNYVETTKNEIIEEIDSVMERGDSNQDILNLLKNLIHDDIDYSMQSYISANEKK